MEEITFWLSNLNSGFGLLTYWSYNLIIVLASIILHAKLRLNSTFFLMAGFTIGTLCQVIGYYKAFEFLSQVAFLSFNIAYVAFLVFAVRVKPRSSGATSNKSLNTDASDAGAA